MKDPRLYRLGCLRRVGTVLPPLPLPTRPGVHLCEQSFTDVCIDALMSSLAALVLMVTAGGRQQAAYQRQEAVDGTSASANGRRHISGIKLHTSSRQQVTL
ncbi:hypothetical protein Pcinc_021575 [Petrolisthes cinctipes]|uniref:Uncharacterized protein n=1 Tax=Petrolisthes cinctipes TaxID=88211 RepID=A0AAE1KHB3_PETCI|nr:hypothetical protein Pcinc_021575 [Petrolisthes cinctipes]